MEEEIYHIKELRMILASVDPHLKLKTYQKNLTSFTLDLTIKLDKRIEVCPIPMDRFRAFNKSDVNAIRDAVSNAYNKLI